MSALQRTTKLLHVSGTCFLGLAVVYLLIYGLHQAGLNWWVVFSLSGHSVVLGLLLFNVYLFAIFRGAVRNQKTNMEHPFTSSLNYMYFYGLSPFLGGVAGIIGMLGVSNLSQYFFGVALATLGGTFLVWIVIDPMLSLLEMLTPVSREHRIERLARAKALREKQQQDREYLLADLQTQEKNQQDLWYKKFRPQVERLTHLLSNAHLNIDQAERETVDIGVSAWQTGGLNCMQQLHKMVRKHLQGKNDNTDFADYISIWWDGIGSWHNKSLDELV